MAEMQILQEQISVATQPSDLLYSANGWSSWSGAHSTLLLSLISDFCSSARRFALRLLPAMDGGKAGCADASTCLRTTPREIALAVG